MKLIKLGMASILAAGALYAGTYNVDASHSNVGFKVKHLMISNVTGKFDKFSGSFEFDEKSGKVTSVDGTVEVASINTDNEKRDGHLKSADFFDAGKYPTITFKVDKIEDEKAYGKFTMRGVTKDVEFDIENTATVTDPWGNKRVGVEISGKVNRKDYGVNWNKALEAGGVVVDETVKIIVELEGIEAK
ncbi:YceI family protein [Arcobacter arenosus]|jgi:polyisoprenoid-binding protein YceI|uniref:Polyisoprenoid-binding protein n=1 Tax=Arcobacter arenosus TaxID=2576037 RepID=A0A5R8Y301_9BACT|nr:YceI family protein [Arcobacter arenosus]TLP39449.1 polyisoprenoid-binding protein [Arcobacter arenosus]